MAKEDVLENKIDNLIDKFDEFLQRYREDTDKNFDDHLAIRKELYGNGSNGGIKYDVMTNSKFRNNITKFLWILIASLFANFIGVIFLLIKTKVV